MRIEVLTPPVFEPVTVAEAKTYGKVDDSNTIEDALITALIVSARTHIEKFLHRSLITQTLRMTLDSRDLNFSTNRYLILRSPPIQSITSVTYYDSEDINFPLSTDYFRKSDSRIIFTDPYRFSNVRTYDSVEIVYVAGYGNASAVPEPIKTALKQLVSLWFYNRETLSSPLDEANGLEYMPGGIKSLLSPYQVYEF